MQYTDYIKLHQSRIEREQQLVNQYNQQPVGMRKQNLWMLDMEKQKRSTGGEMTVPQALAVAAGIALSILVIYLAFFLG
jgi:hypothetical protein